jgi:hypothetical protein
MKKYMVSVYFPEYHTEEFMRLVPDHIEQTNWLIHQGIISYYSLNMDRSRAWMVLNVKGEASAIGILEKFHLYPFMRIEMEQLFVHKGQMIEQPLIMN